MSPAKYGRKGKRPGKYMDATEDTAARTAAGRQGTEPAAAGPGPLPPWLSGLAARHPYLRRYPHSAVAHFPITFMLAAGCFSVLYLLTRVGSFDTTAFYCLGAGVLAIPAAIATGVFGQRLNYPESSPTLSLEKRLAYLLWAMATGAFGWRLLNPQVLRDLQGVNFLYLLLVLALTPLVTLISYFGGMLTFPLEPPA